MKTPTLASLPTCVQKTLSQNSAAEVDIHIQLFSDRIFIVISQLSGKLGSLLQCNHEYSEIDNSHTFHVETLLGKRDDSLNEVYARQIMERIVKLGGGSGGMNMNSCPPVLLGIALKADFNSQEVFRNIIEEVLNLYQEGIKIASSS
jgi:hypothetical protein